MGVLFNWEVFFDRYILEITAPSSAIFLDLEIAIHEHHTHPRGAIPARTSSCGQLSAGNSWPKP